MSGPRYWVPSKVLGLILIALIINGLLPSQTQAISATNPGSVPDSAILASSLPDNNTTPSSATNYHKVIVNTEDKATLTELAVSGGFLLVDYGSFSLWKVADTQTNRLSK